MLCCAVCDVVDLVCGLMLCCVWRGRPGVWSVTASVFKKNMTLQSVTSSEPSRSTHYLRTHTHSLVMSMSSSTSLTKRWRRSEMRCDWTSDITMPGMRHSINVACRLEMHWNVFGTTHKLMLDVNLAWLFFGHATIEKYQFNFHKKHMTYLVRCNTEFLWSLIVFRCIMLHSMSYTPWAEKTPPLVSVLRHMLFMPKKASFHWISASPHL